MKILLTGSGFLAKEFIENFKEHSIIKVPRSILTNRECLKSLIETNKVDCIIHTSFAGVSDGGSEEDYKFNMNVDDNLHYVSNLVDKVFIFGSGIEYMVPRDCSRPWYQKSKAIISLKAKHNPKFVNLRLFGCFGKLEESYRFIKRSVHNLREGKPIVIPQDRRMDFFYVGDLCDVIRCYLEEKELPRDIDCVYPVPSPLLSEIAKTLIENYGPDQSIIIERDGFQEEYTGNCGIESLGIPLKGLDKGIFEIYG